MKTNRNILFLLAFSFVVPAGFEISAAQANPRSAQHVATIEHYMADPAKKLALCAYHQAIEANGKAMTTPSDQPATGSRRQTGQEQQQVDRLRAIGAGQGQMALAAEEVGKDFATAVSILPLVDPIAHLGFQIRLKRHCEAQ
jgi:hypothetical protein